jgi:hypothetical protein
MAGDDQRTGWFLKSGVLEGATEPQSRFKRARKATGERVSAMKDDVVARVGRGRQAVGGVLDDASVWLAGAVGGVDFSSQLSVWLRDTFTTSRATIYDRAMDATYIKTHVGGGLHGCSMAAIALAGHGGRAGMRRSPAATVLRIRSAGISKP